MGVVKRGMDHSFGNQCRESKKAGSILGSLLFPSYLFFHTSDSGQIWDPRKVVFKENLTLLRARRLEKNSWRTLEVTGTNQLTYSRINSAFLIRLGLRWTSLYPSRVLLPFSVISAGFWVVLEV